MLQVPTFALPSSLPHPRAMISWGRGAHNYEPEFWEFEYLARRYLGRMQQGRLEKRHRAIMRNMEALTSPERDLIPIENFLSSWFWFRKEHQTRLEMCLRGKRIDPPKLKLRSTSAVTAHKPKWPNAGDILFRYGERGYLEPLLFEGKLRMFRASKQKNARGDEARFDNECEKVSFMPGQYTRVSTLDGRDLSVRDDLQRAVVGPDYYMLCMSCDWDPTLIQEFPKSDACLIITDVDAFVTRLETAATAILPGWLFHHNPIEYFDPHEIPGNAYINSTMSKDFRFAYQREYRFVFFPLHGQTVQPFVDVPPLGSIQDIAEFCEVCKATPGAMDQFVR
jgi:hypothetical protein